MNVHEAFIQNLIDSPLETYSRLSHEFKSKNYLMGEFEELYPVIEQLFVEMNSFRVYSICNADLGIALMRKLVIQDLRHISIPGIAVMPLGETIRAIARAIEFFDVCVRFELAQGQDLDLSKFFSEEENPKERTFAYYHRYRYLHYFHSLLDKIPDLFLIPTTVPFTGRGLMRFRCVPVFILGKSIELVYVDEFYQTPVEYLIHDLRHASRQYEANLAYFRTHNIITVEEKFEFYSQSYRFSKLILDDIEHVATDTPHQKAMKDLKAIIFFEIVHEDAEPFMADVVSLSLQRKEGFESQFQMPVLDSDTGLMNIQYTKEIGISTLAYVRHKLQNGFYDKIGMINTEIVPEEYRTTRWIAQAAYEILVDIQAVAERNVPTDDQGHVHFDYLLERAVAFGPEIVHQSTIIDPDIAERKEVNIKQYFAHKKGEAEKMNSIVSQTTAYPKELADVRVSIDIILYQKQDDDILVYLPIRHIPPYLDLPCLPGAFLWSKETSQECAERVINHKIVVVSTDNLVMCHVADNPDRDPRNHVISLIFKKELSEAEIPKLDASNFYSIHSLPTTAFDHAENIQKVFKA